MPDGLATIAAANDWHEHNDRVWTEDPPPNNPEFVNTWFLRCQELMDKYQPDLVYFDNDDLPLGQAGLDVTAHFYNSSIARNGSLQCVVNGKNLKPDHTGAITLDIERGRAKEILTVPWQTDTCIGDWHYNRSVFEKHAYKTPRTVIHTLIDVVSKNGNLLLSIPVRGNGTIDEDEHAFLKDLATWLPAHGEAIYGTRPFTVYGEDAPSASNTLTDNKGFSEDKQRPYTAEDIRFTTRGDTLYAFALGWPRLRQSHHPHPGPQLKAPPKTHPAHRSPGRLHPPAVHSDSRQTHRHPPPRKAQPLRLRPPHHHLNPVLTPTDFSGPSCYTPNRPWLDSPIPWPVLPWLSS